MQDETLIYQQNFVPWNFIVVFIYLFIYLLWESKSGDSVAHRKAEGTTVNFCSSLIPNTEMDTQF